MPADGLRTGARTAASRRLRLLVIAAAFVLGYRSRPLITELGVALDQERYR